MHYRSFIPGSKGQQIRFAHLSSQIVIVFESIIMLPGTCSIDFTTRFRRKVGESKYPLIRPLNMFHLLRLEDTRKTEEADQTSPHHRLYPALPYQGKKQGFPDADPAPELTSHQQPAHAPLLSKTLAPGELLAQLAPGRL